VDEVAYNALCVEEQLGPGPAKEGAWAVARRARRGGWTADMYSQPLLRLAITATYKLGHIKVQSNAGKVEA